MQIIPSVYLFVSDFDSVIEPLLTISDPSGKSLVGMHWYYGFDLSCDDETQIAIQENLLEKLRQSKVLESGGASISCEGVAQRAFGLLWFVRRTVFPRDPSWRCLSFCSGVDYILQTNFRGV